MTDLRGYAIVDVETTGLFPGGSDRIVEIAVIRLNESGRLVDTYSSLINPQRDVGPTHIHGITASEVKDAPLFGDIVGDIVHRMRDAALVGHNIVFDRRFIDAELARLEYGLPDIPCLCTMQLSRLADQGVPGRKLEVLCKYFGIDLEDAHTALADAKGTAELFKLFVKRLGGWRGIDPRQYCIEPLCSGISAWPEVEPCGRCYSRERASEEIKRKTSYIETLVSKLPVGTHDDSGMEEYYALLDRVLEDRIVDRSEYSQMEMLANQLGISREQAVSAHHRYMNQLIWVALEDGIISDSEEKDLEAVRRLLGIPKREYRKLLRKNIKRYKKGIKGIREFPDSKTDRDIAGKTVCFTGALTCRIDGNPATRSIAQRAAEDAGMIIKKGVTKNLDFLVTVDPNSMSGKARKARKYGIRIIAEPVFWQMVGINVE